jgi:Uma2 family endonuclease
VKSLLLAVEVLSPSSLRQDRVTKRDFYLANRVDEYWIVDIDARLIERWTPEAKRPDLHRDSISWRPMGAEQAFVLELQEFFEKRGRLPRRI